jgi:hypothetical protein
MGPLGIGGLCRLAAVGRIALIQGGESAPDALQGLDDLTLQLDEDAGSVGVSALLDLLGLGPGLLDDLFRAQLGRSSELALLDEEGGLLLRPRDDALRFVLGTLHET